LEIGFVVLNPDTSTYTPQPTTLVKLQTNKQRGGGGYNQ